MAVNIDGDGWSEHEHSVFTLFQSYTPPFYLKTTGGIYDEEEALCFSTGDEYVVLHKLKVKSVVLTTAMSSQCRVSLRIPLDYAGKFYPVSSSSTQSNEALTLREITEGSVHIPEVRLGNSRQHSKLLVDKLQDNVHCTLKLSEQVMDDFFVGKSKDGQLAFIISAAMNMNSRVKKVKPEEVKHLYMSMSDLNYAIFIVNNDNASVQFVKVEDMVRKRPPPRPPKLKPRPGKSPNSPIHQPDQSSPRTKEQVENRAFSYEVMSPRGGFPIPEEVLKPQGNDVIPSTSPKVTPPPVSQKPLKKNGGIGISDPTKVPQHADDEVVKSNLPTSESISLHDKNLPKSPGKQGILPSFSETNKNPSMDRDMRRTLHKEHVNINIQKGMLAFSQNCRLNASIAMPKFHSAFAELFLDSPPKYIHAISN